MGRQAKRRALLAIRAQTVMLCPQQTTDAHNPQDRLINAFQWVHRPCNAPMQWTGPAKSSL